MKLKDKYKIIPSHRNHEKIDQKYFQFIEWLNFKLFANGSSEITKIKIAYTVQLKIRKLQTKYK